MLTCLPVTARAPLLKVQLAIFPGPEPARTGYPKRERRDFVQQPSENSGRRGRRQSQDPELHGLPRLQR